jgi:SAM-dependent methyltransferase
MMPPEQAGASRASRKVYDAAYFAKWYHNSRTRVHSAASVRRKVRMVVSVAEYFLRREIRSVLDIGAGEGVWRAEIKRLRPSVKYLGIDPSDYVVNRYGKRRNIRLGRFEDLPILKLGRSFDLVVCADVLQYVKTADIERGVQHIARMLGGVAYLESYTSADEMEGDLEGWHPRTKREYRDLFSRAGLVACGLHCYLQRDVADHAVELELL